MAEKTEQLSAVRECTRKIQVLGREIRIHITDTGAGLSILIEGGDRGHIGAVAFAQPGEAAQVTAFAGHREDVICRRWVTELCRIYKGPVVVCAGVHYDNIGHNEIEEILNALNQELERINTSVDEKETGCLLAGISVISRQKNGYFSCEGGR
jgi:hypothetical protein